MSDNESLCPGCGKPPTKVRADGGWRFYCKPCDWSYGHPQLTTYDEALALVRAAKSPATQAFIAARKSA